MNIMQVLHKGREEATEPPKIQCLPYVRGLSEKLERVCIPLGVKAAFRPMRTLRQAQVKVKTPIPEEKKKGVMYEVPCKDCHRVHIGATKRTLKVRLGEHKQAVRRGDPKNGIAVHAHESNHVVDWDDAQVRSVSGYWQRRKALEKAGIDGSSRNGLGFHIRAATQQASWEL